MNRESPRNKVPETGVGVYRLECPIRHSAPGIEILFVLNGGVRLEAGNMACRLAEPDVLLLSRCEIVHITPDGEDCLLLVLRVAPNFLSSAFGGVLPAFECSSTRPGSPDCALIRSILAEAACYGMAGSGGENALLVNSALLRLLHELKRNFSVSEEDENRETETERERMINAYIKKNYRYPLALEELADRLALTPQYLSRYFRKQFGVNFHAYLNSFRLQNAVKDLVLSDATVTAIAYDNGFPNLSSFLKILKDSTGKTPTEYRKAHRIQEQGGEKDVISEEKEESDFAREKLRPYIKVENSAIESNIFFQKKLVFVEADARKGIRYERPWGDSINLGFVRDFTGATFFDQINLLQSEVPFRYGRFQGLFGKSTLISMGGGGGGDNFLNIYRIINFLFL
jgi:AraC-like DNA-binding protein